MIGKENTMKKLLVLLVICCMLMTTLASCDLLDKILGREHTEHVDADGDQLCDVCGADLKIDVPPSPGPECTEHKDDDGDEKCDVCGADVPKPEPPVCTEHKDDDGDEKCDVCGADVPKPEPPVCTEHKDEDGDYKCDVCQYVMFENVSYSLNIGDLATGVRSEDDINGMFTIVSGSEIRNRTKTYQGVEYTKSVKIGNAKTMIKVNVPGTGKLRFLIQNGSSGVDMQYTKVIGPDGTVYDIEFVAGVESNPVVMIELDVTEGVWTIARGKNGGTQDVFYLELECTVATSPECGFEVVSEGKVDYLTNETLNLDTLRLNAKFENGKTEPLALENVSVDVSKVDMTVAGEYPITITYKDYEPITYMVKVYAPQSIELGFDAIEKLSQNSAAGNGVYYNHSVKELYFVGEKLDTTGLTVTVIAACGEKSIGFIVDNYTVSCLDFESADIYTVEIGYADVKAEYKVWATDAVPTPNEDGEYWGLVDPAYLGLPGVMSGPYHVFQTIQEALDFFATIDPAAQKKLYIAPGQYNEKLEITIPNLSIIGLGEKPEDVVIEWDSLYGQLDASGFVHTTDSTATVAIRDGAYNVKIDNITISNYWNTQERMDKAGLAIERGLALLVQADRFIMTNSRLLGIQDTLELFTGRQYFENVFISGYTDFIFGTNNITYFKNCTIHVIDTEKDDKGTAGYITAFKGNNKGASDSIVYGAIFDGCKFTADEGVTPGCTALGRPWGTHAAVAIINSELGGHISVKGFTGGKNERYVSMTAKPTDSTVQYLEYNNTGAGAIAEEVAGMKMLTAEEAANYSDFSVIFGKTNGNVNYLDPWNPKSNDVVVDDRTYYFFNGGSSTTGTSYTYDQNLQGTTGSIGDIAIDATAGKVTSRGSDTQMNTGAKLTFNVEAGTLVTFVSYPGYGLYTVNGISHNANDTFSVYFAEDTEVVFVSTGTTYFYQIIIDPNSEAPEAPVLQQIKVEGMNTNYTVGDEISLEGAVVKAYYSDYSIVTIADYSVDTSAVDKSVAGTYDVVFSYGEVSATVPVTYEGSDADPAITESILLDFTTQDGLDAINNNKRITIEPVAGQYYFNNGNSRFEGTISFMVKAGAKIIITPYHDAKYVSYTIGYLGEEELMTYTGAYTYEVDSDCTMVYTGLSGNYICSIQIVYPAAKENVSITFGSEGNYKTSSALNISGMSTRDNGNNNTQLSSGSMTLTVYAGATVTIHGYPGYTSYKISNGINETEEITATEYTYLVEADGELIISAVNSNNYLYGIDITY